MRQSDPETEAQRRRLMEADVFARESSGDFLLGAEVINLWNDNLGSLRDLIIDPKTARVTHAIIRVGGVVFGIGGKKVAVPFEQFRRIGPNHVLYVGRTDLDRMPSYEGVG